MASKRKAKKKPAKVGRPRTEMTDENIDAILRTVALGVWPDRAAQMHGVSTSTMRMHKQRHPEFVTALEKAEAQAESGYLSKILRHTEKQWTAAAWMMERRWPDRWGKRDPKPEQPIESDVDVWRAMLAAIPGRNLPGAS